MSLLDQIEGIHQRLLRPTGGCHQCPRKRVDFVPATLPSSNILWLGEAPGEIEVEQGKGFVGPAGQELRKHARPFGLEVEACSNTIHCRPPKNATPSPKEVENCLSEFVLDEIQEYPIVVMCGSVALKALFPHAVASHFRGNVAHHPDFPGQRFYAIYHPSYMLRRPDLLDEFKRQLNRLARIAAGEPPAPWTVYQGGGKRYWNKLEKALATPLLSLDLETNSLHSWKIRSKQRSMSFTADGKSILFVHEDEPHFVATLDKVREYLERKEKSVVGSHIGFDLEWLERDLNFTVQCLGIHEVPIIYYEARGYKQPSLKTLVSQQLDGYRYLVYDPTTEKDLVLLANYNAEDVIYPLQLFKQGIKLLKPSTRDLVTRVLGPTELVLQRMHTHGLYLRQDYRKAKIEEYEDKRRAAVLAWREEDPEFIPTVHESGKGLHQYLFKIRGLPVISRTKKGEVPSMDQGAIKEWIRGGASYLQHLLVIKECEKILSTYLTGYDKHLGSDSRVHPSFHLTRTDTGRPSSSKPNTQNIPRPREIRDLFGVPPGSIMVEADLSQIEFRIMVCLAQDETGIAMYLRGEDAHITTAKSFAEHPTDEQRNYAKPVNFSLLYGGGAFNVQRAAKDDYGLEWEMSKCEEWVTIFFETYPSLPIFHTACETKFRANRGWFESITGHIHHYNNWDSPDRDLSAHEFRAALNSEAQGPAAHICFYIMAQAQRLLHQRKLIVHFVNTVHDSMLMELPQPKQLYPVIETLEEACALAYEWVKRWFVVPLVMDYKSGESWGSLEKIKLTR